MSPPTVARELFSCFSDRGKVVVFCYVLNRKENEGSAMSYRIPYGFQQHAPHKLHDTRHSVK